jgi:hypothetical protein
MSVGMHYHFVETCSSGLADTRISASYRNIRNPEKISCMVSPVAASNEEGQ